MSAPRCAWCGTPIYTSHVCKLTPSARDARKGDPVAGVALCRQVLDGLKACTCVGTPENRGQACPVHPPPPPAVEALELPLDADWT